MERLHVQQHTSLLAIYGGGGNPGMRIRIRPLIFETPDPDPLLFLLDPDPDPTCNNGFIKLFTFQT